MIESKYFIFHNWLIVKSIIIKKSQTNKNLTKLS